MINTHFGYTRDGLDIKEEQIGVFDASYRLKRVRTVRSSRGQYIVDRKLSLSARLEGYAASGVVGLGGRRGAYAVCRRWIPLMYGYDRYGRLRGSVGAVMLTYDGVHKGSAWAFFGAANEDLFSPSRPQMRRALLDVAAAMLRKTFLRVVKTDLACYRQGETVKVSVFAVNMGSQGRRG